MIEILKIKLSNKIKSYYLDNKYYSTSSIEQFIDLFLPNNIKYVFVNSDEKSDITIWDIQQTNNEELNDDEINMLLCIENCLYFNHYEHYNLYGNYGNNKIKIYIYNHINKIEITDNYIAIPMIYNFINYFKNNYEYIKPSEIISFNKKKFCLVINKSSINKDIEVYSSILNKYGNIDNINLYNELILNKSCYNSVELLNVFNKYKFILCFENSYNDGYITEKIFNCFFARTIPIYKGSNIIDNYINEKSYLKSDNIDILEKNIEYIINNQEEYNKLIYSNKISNNYDNENYEEILKIFIKNNLSNTN